MTALVHLNGVGFGALLSNVSFAIEPGQVWAILGPNGAGKSTLAKLVMGILAPTQGTISGSARGARNVAWVPQHLPPAVDFSVLEVVLMGRTPHLQSRWGVPSENDVALATDALREVELEKLGQRVFSTLSGGEQRRVLLARALAQQPQLLVLDEPTSHLDLKHQRSLVRCINQRRAAGLSVMAVLHDVNIASQLATHALLLKAGHLVAIGEAHNVLRAQELSRLYDTPMHVGSAWIFELPSEKIG
jgi:iron complex transport system ATP-binding protein